MIRKSSLLHSIRKTVYFSASKTRLSLRDCARRRVQSPTGQSPALRAELSGTATPWLRGSSPPFVSPLPKGEARHGSLYKKVYSINNLPREDPSSRGCLYTSQFIFGFSRRLRFLGFLGMKIQKITSATMPAASRTHFSITFHLDSVIFGSGSGSG